MPENREKPALEVGRLPDVWRCGASRPVTTGQTMSTQYPALDEVLPGRGWPYGYLTEILSRRTGSGELSLLMPALQDLSAQGRWLIWIAPPNVPNAPALAAAGIDLSRVLLVRPGRKSDLLWTAEQALRQAKHSPVLIWLDACPMNALRRLQLAAAEGESLGVIFRPLRFAKTSSPAALRLTVSRYEADLHVDILKVRGARPVQNLRLRDSGSPLLYGNNAAMQT